jgi:hypothetical protein
MSREERIVFWAGGAAVFGAMALVGSVRLVWVVSLGCIGGVAMWVVAIRDIHHRWRFSGNRYIAEQIALVLAIAGVGVAAGWTRDTAVYAAGLIAVLVLAIVLKRLTEHR